MHLKEELMEVQNRCNIIMSQNSKLKNEIKELEARLSSRGSLPSEGESSSAKVKDIDHVKDILLKFLKETPITSESNEQLLMIVFSMLYMTKSQIDDIQRARKEITAIIQDDMLKKKKKGGVFGGLFKRNSKKK